MLFNLIFVLFSSSLFASVNWEGFLDTYYAYDLNRPRSGNRAFTTQQVRHNEPNINLAFGGFNFQKEKWRGRFVLQGGNSVEFNTLAESSDLRYIQEAYVGYQAGTVWIDGGIYLGHIGGESWISRDNWTYTRSLNLDYVPYYSTGLRISQKIGTNDSFQFHLMNGWQNMREDNHAKSFGLQYAHQLSEKLSFTYNNFFGDEEVVPSEQTGKYRPRFRGYHNMFFKWLKDERWNYLLAIDVGHQAQRDNTGVDPWWAANLTIRRVLNQTQSLAFRAEQYQDPHQANIQTLTPGGFQVTSASLNFDQKIPHGVLWRTEVRGYHSRDRIFPEDEHGKNRLDGFFVTSLSISLP